MHNKYFDKWEFKDALEYMESDPIRANDKFEEYLRRYPNDYGIIVYYISNLITLGKFDIAKKYINYLEDKVKTDKQFLSYTKKVEQLKSRLIFNKLRIYSYTKDYKKFYQLFFSLPDSLRKNEYSIVFNYVRKQDNKSLNDLRHKDSYMYNQIVNYSEGLFREHINKHLADYNCNLDEPNPNVFSVDFPIDKVLEEVKKYIPSDKRLCSGFLENVYVFKYDSCGRDKNKVVDYFKVICFHDTCDMITIVPVNKIENMPYVDLNYMIENKYESKRESARDRFNRKLKRK